MTCYIVPVAAALVHHGIRKSKKELNDDPRQSWLTLLLAGGGAFGFIDHLWNGQLLTSSNLLSDLALGTAITLGIFGLWEILVLRDMIAVKKPVVSQ